MEIQQPYYQVSDLLLLSLLLMFLLGMYIYPPKSKREDVQVGFQLCPQEICLNLPWILNLCGNDLQHITTIDSLTA